jgi:hypothetical protein
MHNILDAVWRPHARRLSIAFTSILAGCAPHTSDVQPNPEVVLSAQTAQPDRSACRPPPALLAPQSAPDCAFDRAHLRTIDPVRWSRLKVEYEKVCYQRAEKAVRERLRLLQAASRCEMASR